MAYLTYVFPAATLVAIVLFFTALPDTASVKVDACGDTRIRKKEYLLLSFITVAYALVAFCGLGDRTAPQSYANFELGQNVTIDLGESCDINEIFCFCGIRTGNYTVDLSDDGMDFRSVGLIDQNYANVLKWVDADFDEAASLTARYVRLTAGAPLDMGEMCIRTSQGVFSGSGPLFDESDLVPDEQSYLNSSYFDEIYHARTAMEHLDGIKPYEISHPPLGKLIIGLGIRLFGRTPFGWRFTGTLTGVLMLPLMFVLLKKMFGGSLVPLCGTAILATDFMHFTQTRIATIDSYAVFFILLMYLFMYLYVTGGRLRDLALSGVFFGFGIAGKWTCFYAGAGLAVIWLIHWIRHFDFRSFIKNCLFCLVFFVLIPGLIYYVSYYAYGQAAGMHGIGMFFRKDYAKLVLDNQQYMFHYHAGVDSTHPYSSRWYQWIADIRPILYYLHYFEDGSRSSFGAFLNPLLCWGGLLALGICAYLAAAKKDRVSEFICIGYLAQLLPWVFISRTTFEYHYFACSVFLLLALCRIMALMLQGKKEGSKLSVYGLTALSAVLFILFYPVLSGMWVNANTATHLLKWLPTWPF